VANGVDRGGRLAREIEHHRSIADRAEIIWNWDSPSGRRRARRRAELFVEHGRLGPGVRALELGCGTGVFLERVAASGARLRGLDLSQELLARARARLDGLRNVSLDCGNAEQMPYTEASFDVVYGSSVLHHLHLEAALGEVLRVLRPGGRVVFAEPNLLNPQVALMFKLGLTKRYFGVSPDEMAFSRFRARRALRAVGYAEPEVRPFDFLHPATPAPLIGLIAGLGRVLEALPLAREITGSFLVLARKPGGPPPSV
jgi:SAM-dependent methyltransferase